MIYLDNAATTYPKPESVYRAADIAARECGGNPGRGVHRLSLKSANIVFETREKLADMFGATPERVVFTANTTYALNLAIKGLWGNKSGSVLISDIEHNSVRRPVLSLAARKDIRARIDSFSTRGGRDAILSAFRAKIRDDTQMAVVCHRSNIAPITLPIADIGRICREKGIFFIVDAAQSAGALRINMTSCSIDALCIPGHKGMYGLMGVGAVIFSDRVDEESLSTIVEGGSGMASLEYGMPPMLPERLEAGTLALPAIASLGAGLDYVNGLGIENIAAHEGRLVRLAYEMLASSSRAVLYGSPPRDGSAMIFGIAGRSPTEVAAYLDDVGICTRAGLHCSPLAHHALGTPNGGAVRISFSPMNTERDIEKLYKAIKLF